ncbi:MAG: penicillin-binding transpeptidase domain-containing protein [Bryobacteraceae bacterium]
MRLVALVVLAPVLSAGSLERVAAEAMGARQGAVVVLDVVNGKPLAVVRPQVAKSLVARPGSTIKPFTLEALVKAGLAGHAVCARRLMIGSRNLSCSHPEAPGPLSASEALSYSCNSWFASMAARLQPDDLVLPLRAAGFGVRSRPASVEALQLLALGEGDVRVTPLALAEAYRKLASSVSQLVRQGLVEATTYGTARLAAVPGLEVAGKTGTATSDGSHKHAWFAGFAPARAPRVVVVVYVESGQGGADAAPVAHEVFAAWQRGLR